MMRPPKTGLIRLGSMIAGAFVVVVLNSYWEDSREASPPLANTSAHAPQPVVARVMPALTTLERPPSPLAGPDPAAASAPVALSEPVSSMPAPATLSEPAAVAVSPSSDGTVTRPSTLLNSCWTLEQLRGTASDKNIRRRALDPAPPARVQGPVTALSPAQSRSIRFVRPPNGEKWVALTFDLCEQAHEISGYDAALVNYLRDHSVKATFFAGGKWMRSHPDKTMQLMADPLFELGNHSWSHANLRMTTGADLYDQIQWTQDEYRSLREKLLKSACAMALGPAVAATLPAAPTLFRFPYGTCNSQALAAVNGQGLAAIQWDVVTGDPTKGQTARQIARTVLEQVKPGSIVIAHANGRGWHTAEALPLIIPALRARGYRFVTVSEMLAQGEAVAVDACYELKPGDNLKYDRLFGAGSQ